MAGAASAPLGTVAGTLSAAGEEAAAAPTEGQLPEAPTTGVFPEAPAAVPPPTRGPGRSYVSTGGFGARVGLLTCLWPSTGTYDPTLSVGGYYGGRPDGFMGSAPETPMRDSSNALTISSKRNIAAAIYTTTATSLILTSSPLKRLFSMVSV